MGVNRASGMINCDRPERLIFRAFVGILNRYITTVNHSFARIWEKTPAWPVTVDLGDYLSDFSRNHRPSRFHVVPECVFAWIRAGKT